MKRECEKYKTKKILVRIIKEQIHLIILGQINSLEETYLIKANTLFNCNLNERETITKTISKIIWKARLIETTLYKI